MMNCDLDDVFNKASNYVTQHSSSLSSEQLLILYSHYKQSLEGECNVPKPGMLDFKGKKKWEAWKKLKNMSKEEAKQFYIETVNDLFPDWNEDPNCGKVGWVTVSTLASTFEENIDSAAKNIFDYVKDNNLDKIDGCNRSDYALTDEEGMTPLHWAADRGFNNIVCHLLKNSVDVNSRDNTGQTALHFATSCGHTDVVATLLQSNADLNITDTDGSLPIDYADTDELKSLFNKFIRS